MKLLTWNLWQYSVPWGCDPACGVVPHYPADAPRPAGGALWRLRRAAILAVLAAERPDVVLLQEAASDATAAPGAPNQAAQLAAASGYGIGYQPASVSRMRTAESGQAVLAAPGWAITSQATRVLPSAGWPAKDSARLALAVDLDGPAGGLRVVDVHLSLDAAARQRSLEEIRAWTAGLPPLPSTVLAGDCNDVPDSPAIAGLTAAGWRDCWADLYPADAGPTFPTPAPFIRLDYVFLAPAGRLRPVAARRVGLDPDPAGFYPSDHAGLIVELQEMEVTYADH